MKTRDSGARLPATLIACFASSVLAGALLGGCHRDQPVDHMTRGKDLATKGDHRGAIIEFKNVLQEDAKSLEARFLLGRELLAQGDTKPAEIELQKAYDGQYQTDAVLPLLIKSQLLQGQYEKVERGIAASKPTTPAANAELQNLLGSALLAQQKTDSALVAFQRATQVNPDQHDALIGIARILLLRNDLPGATKQVDAVLAKDPKQTEALTLKGDIARTQRDMTGAIEAYKAAIAADPQNTLAQLNLAGTYVSTKQLDLAQQLVDGLKKKVAGAPGVAYMDGLIAFVKKDYPRANDAITAALNGMPRNGSAQTLAGAVALELNQPVQAEAHFREALKIIPGSIYVRRSLASIYLRQRDAQRADEVLAPALAAAPDDPALLALAGEVALTRGDFTNAGKYLDKSAKLNPADGTVRTKSAAIDFARGDDSAGFAELESATKVAGTNSNPDIALVLARVQHRQFDQALTAWKALEKREPNSPITYNLLAAIDLGKQDVPGARKALERALEIQPNYFPAAANLAQFAIREGRLDDARNQYKALLKADPANMSGLLALAQFESNAGSGANVVLPLLKEARRTNATSETPVLALTSYYQQTGDAKQALVTAQEGLASSPNSATYINLVGQLLMQTGSPDQSLAMYRKLVTQYPNSPEAQLKLGFALTAANQPDAAVETFKTVFNKAPTAYDVEAAAFGAMLRANQTTQAESLLQAIREQSPKSPYLQEFEGDLRISRKQYADAANIYRKVLSQAPSSSLAVKTSSALRLSNENAKADAVLTEWLKSHPKDLTVRAVDAEVALRSKEYPRANQDYRAILEVRPKDVLTLNNLAWSLWQQRDPQATSMAQQAHTLAPNSPEISDTLGWMLFEQGDTKRGLELLEKANTTAPGRRDIALHLAKAQLKDGRKDSARKILQGIVDEVPDSAEGQESKRLLAAL